MRQTNRLYDGTSHWPRQRADASEDCPNCGRTSTCRRGYQVVKCPALGVFVAASRAMWHVGPRLQGRDMATRRQLRGVELRYALTNFVFQHGPHTVADLIEALEYQCFEIPGRASKVVSDACVTKSRMAGSSGSSVAATAPARCLAPRNI